MNSKSYVVYRNNLRKKQELQILETDETGNISSLILSLLKTKQLYLSRGYFAELKSQFKKISKNKISEDNVVIVLEETQYHPELKIELQTSIFERKFFVKSLYSNGINFVGEVNQNEHTFELRKKNE